MSLLTNCIRGGDVAIYTKLGTCTAAADAHLIATQGCEALHRSDLSKRPRFLMVMCCANDELSAACNQRVGVPLDEIKRTKKQRKEHTFTRGLDRRDFDNFVKVSKRTWERLAKDENVLLDQTRISWYSFAPHRQSKHLAKQRKSTMFVQVSNPALQVFLACSTLPLLVDYVCTNSDSLTANDNKCKLAE